ncbi:kelch-like protein diablo [Mizuhopecten yessoensis]|uniref:kelch-like protein diablo n=1 Tax=Mizuhopecten yessoensis TaxID=6573 RepID=UPI000B45EEE3|nr:kelch-like protein diablo [Mizuhopecten yessoensis]
MNDSISRTPSKVRARRESLQHLQEIPVRDTGTTVGFPSDSGHAVQVTPHSLLYQDSRISIIDKRRQSDPPGDNRRTNDTTAGNSRRTTSANGIVLPKPQDTGNRATPSTHVELSKFLYNLWRNQEMCDIVIRVGDTEYKAHKLALAAYSDKFNSKYCERLQTSISEVNLSASSREAVEEVLQYIYTSKLNLTLDNVDDVIGCSSQLGINSALDICKSFLFNFTPDNLFNMWWIADKHDLLDVLSILETAVCDHFGRLYTSVGYLRGHFEQVRHFICKDNLGIRDELDVFLAVTSWIDFNRQDRLRHAPDLLSCVRLVHISPEHLTTQVEVVDYLFQIPVCNALLMSAYRYHALRYSGSDVANSTNVPKRRTTHPATDLDHVMGRNLCQNNSFSTVMSHSSPVKESCRTTQKSPSPSKSHHLKSFHSLAVSTPNLPLPERPTTLFAVGGVDPFDTQADVACRMVEQYNPRSNSWHRVTTLPETRHHLGVAMLDGFLFVIGGSVLLKDDIENLANPTDVNFRYDPVNNSWAKIACLRQPRMYLSVSVLEGILYAVGGNDSYGRSLDSVEYYDPDLNQWGYIAPMTTPKIGVATAGYQGHLYVVGGFQDVGGQRAVLSSVECYNPRTNSWTFKNPLPVPCCHANLVDARGSLYLLGGSTIPVGSASICSLRSVYRYCDDEDVWELVANMRIPRHDAGAAVIDSRIYVIGGVSSDEGRALMDTECLDVDHDLMTWVDDLRPLGHPVLGIACCTLDGDNTIN